MNEINRASSPESMDFPLESQTTLETNPKKANQGKTRAEIRRARAARNRCSARRSRLRKKAENERDKEKAMVVERRNATLKRRVAELRDKMVGLQRVVAALGLSEEMEWLTLNNLLTRREFKEMRNEKNFTVSSASGPGRLTWQLSSVIFFWLHSSE